MARRRNRSSESNIWPGFVDALSTLLLVMMFVLSMLKRTLSSLACLLLLQPARRPLPQVRMS
jgi:hypothetical protein